MILEIKNIQRLYKKQLALNDFSLSIDLNKNKIYGLIGPNGAGKTTLLKIIAEIYRYKEGNISFIDCNLNYAEWCKKNVCFIPSGERGLRMRNNIYDNVIYFSTLKGICLDIVKKNFEKYSEILKFNSFYNRKIYTLSSGEKKKASLLCGVCSNCKMILLDEPTNALDISAEVDLQNAIREITKQTNTVFVISSHDIEFFSEIVEHYIFIFKGHNVYEFNENAKKELIKEKYFELEKNYK